MPVGVRTIAANSSMKLPLCLVGPRPRMAINVLNSRRGAAQIHRREPPSLLPNCAHLLRLLRGGFSTRFGRFLQAGCAILQRWRCRGGRAAPRDPGRDSAVRDGVAILARPARM